MDKKRCPGCFREFEEAVCPHCGSAQNEEHQLPVGTVLRDRYQIGRVLGQGGFGITYVSWDTLLDKCVAVKEFYPCGTVFRRSELSTAVECGTKAMVPHYEYSRERFLREARALAKFQDIPEVVGLLDFVKENNTAYIVMEYVRGVNLAKYIAMKGGRLSVHETFRILKPVMEALAKVHKGGIIHRDISPDNIILEPMGGAKLLDFGAVRAVEDPDVEKGLNKSTEAILKQGFAPIEQYNTRGSLGPWTDEYAMCATVWYCLTGKIPEEASIRMSEGIDPDWGSIEGLPEHQQKALEKGFSCRARDRYTSMDALLESLFPSEERKTDAAPAPVTVLEESVAEAVPVTVPEEHVAESVPTTAKASKKRKKSLAIAVTAVTAVLAVTVLVASLIPKPPQMAPTETLPPMMQDVTEQTEQTQATTEPISEEERQYLLAEQLLADGNFQEAIDIFSALGNYKDSTDRIPQCHYAWAEAELKTGNLGYAAIRFGKLAGYSDAKERSLEIWNKIAVRNSLAAGSSHTLGLKIDNTVIAAGYDFCGQCDVKNWSNIVAIAADYYQTFGLQADGTVVATGYNQDGQCNIRDWTNIVSIAAGDFHTLGLRNNGSVLAVGINAAGQCDVDEWSDIVAVAAGYYHSLGLKADGTVVAAGMNNYGQCNTADWNDIVAIAAGEYYTLGLKNDGTVLAVGRNDNGECNTGGWSDIVAIATGGYHTLGLKANGSVIATGDNAYGQCNVEGWTNVVAIAGGHGHSVCIKEDGTTVAVGLDYVPSYSSQYYRGSQCDVDNWTNMLLPKESAPFR